MALRTAAPGMMMGVRRNATSAADWASAHRTRQKAGEELVETGRKNCYLQWNWPQPVSVTVAPRRKMVLPLRWPKVAGSAANPEDRPVSLR